MIKVKEYASFFYYLCIAEQEKHAQNFQSSLHRSLHSTVKKRVKLGSSQVLRHGKKQSGL